MSHWLLQFDVLVFMRSSVKRGSSSNLAKREWVFKNQCLASRSWAIGCSSVNPSKREWQFKNQCLASRSWAIGCSSLMFCFDRFQRQKWLHY
jgi:hypothetical protein